MELYKQMNNMQRNLFLLYFYQEAKRNFTMKKRIFIG